MLQVRSLSVSLCLSLFLSLSLSLSLWPLPPLSLKTPYQLQAGLIGICIYIYMCWNIFSQVLLSIALVCPFSFQLVAYLLLREWQAYFAHGVGIHVYCWMASIWICMTFCKSRLQNRASVGCQIHICPWARRANSPGPLCGSQELTTFFSFMCSHRKSREEKYVFL